MSWAQFPLVLRSLPPQPCVLLVTNGPHHSPHHQLDVNSGLEAGAARAGCQGHFGPHNCHTLVGHLTIGTLRARWPIWNQMILLCCKVIGDRQGTKPNLACAAMGTKPPDQRIECVLMHACQSPSLGKQHSHSASEGNLH